jgi:hypothetical protein
MSYNHCIAMCGAWPLGSDSDIMGNTLGCRAYHAVAAASSPTHCFHAGPYGADFASGNATCGTQCEAYCSIMLLKPGCNDTLRAFNTMAECTAACALIPSNISNYEATTGNSLQCRIYHAKVAFSGGQTTLDAHCAHAAPLGGGQCGDPVVNYCTIVNGLCTGALSQGMTSQYCMDVAKFIPNNTAGKYNDYDGDSLACRAYHSIVGGAAHCPHGGISGAGACGTGVCDTFCALSAKVCPSNYANTAACLSACAMWNTTAKLGTVTDQSGDTFYCRLYHLGAAANGTTAATTHCPHAVASSTPCGGGASPTPSPTPGPSGSAVVLGFSVLALIANLF